MPGRIKYRHHSHSTIPHARQRKVISHLTCRSMADSNTGVDASSIFSSNTGSNGFHLNKSTIVWLTIICVIVLAMLVIISCLLCRCKRRSKRAKRQSEGGTWHTHHPSLEVTDGRNEHYAWNRKAVPPGQSRIETGESGFSLQPLTKAAIKPAGTSNYPAEPMIVEEEVPIPGTPVFHARKTPSRYYSGLSSAWKRLSQIGRAY